MENPSYQQTAELEPAVAPAAYGGNYQTITDLFNGAYNVIVNYTLNNDVSNEAKSDLEFLENRLLEFASIPDFKVPQDVLLMVRDQIHAFLTKHQRQFAPVATANNNYGISPQQDAFTQRLVAIIISLQTFIRLGNDVPAITKAYTAMLRLKMLESNAPSLTETFGLTDVKLEVNFMKSITRRSTINFDHLYGIPQVIKTIKDTLENIRFSQNKFIFLILSGPPGTGKSSIAKAMATEFSNSSYFNLGIGELSSPTIGVTEKGLREAFGKFEKSKDNVTIVFDEMDNIFSKVIKQAAHINSVKVTLQTEISGGRDLKNNVLMVGITNYYNTLEDVIKRRATKVVYVPIPSIEDSYSFLISLLKIPEENLQDSFKTSLQQLLFNNPNNNYTNANMENIHTNAISSFIGRFDQFNASPISNNSDLLIESNSLKVGQMNFVLTPKRDLPNQINYIIVPEITDYRFALKSTAIMSDLELERYRLSNDPDHLVDISPECITTTNFNTNTNNNNNVSSSTSTSYNQATASAPSTTSNYDNNMIVEKKNKIKRQEPSPPSSSSSSNKSKTLARLPPTPPPQPPQFKTPTTASSKRSKKPEHTIINNYSSDESEKERPIPRKTPKSQKSIKNVVDTTNNRGAPDERPIARKTQKSIKNVESTYNMSTTPPPPLDESFELVPADHAFMAVDSTTDNFDMSQLSIEDGSNAPIIEMPSEDEDMNNSNNEQRMVSMYQ